MSKVLKFPQHYKAVPVPDEVLVSFLKGKTDSFNKFLETSGFKRELELHFVCGYVGDGRIDEPFEGDDVEKTINQYLEAVIQGDEDLQLFIAQGF